MSPSPVKGHVSLDWVLDAKNMKKKVILAHNGKIQCLALNKSGALLATASEKGTIIRIFNTETAKVL